MNLQYYHHKNDFKRYTAVVDIPDKQVLIDIIKGYLIGDHNQTYMRIGYALVHPEDRYVRSMGRVVAESKMNRKDFKLNSLIFTPEGFDIFFTRENIEIFLNIKYNRDKVHLLSVEI